MNLVALECLWMVCDLIYVDSDGIVMGCIDGEKFVGSVMDCVDSVVMG